MKLRLVSVFDEKLKIFSQIGCTIQDGAAIRDFGDQVNNPSSPYFRHPEDFKLYCVGEFDDNSGQVTGFPQPEFLAHGSKLFTGAK